ncbi:hypothetical protein [Paraburkholderia sp. BL21I4N1]|uniref:hypothetical protein n=1 Tax=Paraburkholderia sp. BL21I4N1 TaxID=1938801 RepID=UPI002157A300|nr:hypothetical protein [Paraburkholderia sp. BL21I4N1]
MNFALTALRNDGLPKRVMSGYRPIYKARPDYWSSAYHEFVDGKGVETGGNSEAEVWLLTPQAYPQAFWIGRRVEVAEGTRIVGLIEVLQILNPLLKLSDTANESPPALVRQMEIPQGIKNEALWRKRCRKIHARAKDLLEGRVGIIETARAMNPLAFWTCADSNSEFELFRAIDSETLGLPAGAVRQYWAPEALESEDVRIEAAESRWREQALAAAERLVERYSWALQRKDQRSDEA